MAAPSTQAVIGDLLKVDGEFYVVKDMAGKEVRLHTDKTTTLDGAIKAGDKVEAQATEKITPCLFDAYSLRSRLGDTKVEILATEIGLVLKAGPIRT